MQESPRCCLQRGPCPCRRGLLVGARWGLHLGASSPAGAPPWRLLACPPAGAAAPCRAPLLALGATGLVGAPLVQ
eukprot:11362385-Alexandrium_andersonii.AAC.1